MQASRAWNGVALRRRVGGAILATLALCTVGCSQTPLNMAPVVDHSRPFSETQPVASGQSSASPAAAPANAGVAGAPASYVAQKGDTLYHISTICQCSVRDLVQWNGLDETAPLQVGQRLRLGPAEGNGAKPASTGASEEEAAVPAQVSAVAVVPAQTIEAQPLEANPAPSPTPATGNAAPSANAASTANAPPSPIALVPAAPAQGGASGSSGWMWPVDGTVSTGFDPVHGKGIDIAVGEDAPVRAVADGTVSYTGSPLDFGKLVIITHEDGLRSVYAHNKTIVAKQGERVVRGQVIATAGKTGSRAPYLHFEVRGEGGVAIDPLGKLPRR